MKLGIWDLERTGSGLDMGSEREVVRVFPRSARPTTGKWERGTPEETEL